MRKVNVTEVVSCYRDCPFFGTEGMEHVMVCNHPHWDTQPPYSGLIITQRNRDGIPDKCPLKQGSTVTTSYVRLK